MTAPCQCGDSYCSDTFGRATRGQDRSGCCQYCGFFCCDVCGWADPSGKTFGDYLRTLYPTSAPGGIR
jgi:hypothetical protein